MNVNKSEIQSIRFGSKSIVFELTYTKRKSLEISVYPDLSVKVIAPQDRSLEEVLYKIHKRAAWILEQKDFFSIFFPKPTKKKYISGETHYYLGKQYRLKVEMADVQKVLLQRGYLHVFTEDRHNSSQIGHLLNRWYRERARQIFEKHLEQCYKKIQKYDVKPSAFVIRQMSHRWGSCSKTGKIILNDQLVKAPSHCIDYVIMHELCHQKYFNHGRKFYALLSQVLPDWEKRKKRLEKVLI